MTAATIRQQKKIPKKIFEEIISEDRRRMKVLFIRYDPLTGKDAPGKRVCV